MFLTSVAAGVRGAQSGRGNARREHARFVFRGSHGRHLLLHAVEVREEDLAEVSRLAAAHRASHLTRLAAILRSRSRGHHRRPSPPLKNRCTSNCSQFKAPISLKSRACGSECVFHTQKQCTQTRAAVGGSSSSGVADGFIIYFFGFNKTLLYSALAAFAGSLRS
jgi:hypothetical protein